MIPPGTPGYEPLQDCCCMTTPRVLRRAVAILAFNFSAVPERVPLPKENFTGDPVAGPHQLLRFFGQIKFPAAS